METPDSIKAYSQQWAAQRKTVARYIKENLGFNIARNSNGETGFQFFTETIKPYGLYILDEPENSLEAERQIDLASFISSMARYERCQFVISTHSPFIMSIPEARLYNLDVYPAGIMSWTDVKSVKVYRDFFKAHEGEFRE